MRYVSTSSRSVSVSSFVNTIASWRNEPPDVLFEPVPKNDAVLTSLFQHCHPSISFVLWAGWVSVVPSMRSPFTYVRPLTIASARSNRTTST